MSSAPPTVAIAFHETTVGGASQSLLRILPLLGERGWTFTAWTPGPGSLRDELAARGLAVAGEPRLLRLSLASLAEPPGAVTRLSSVPAYLRAFRAWIKKQRASLLHANTLVALPEAVAARRTGTPALLHVHETLPDGPKGRAAALLVRFAADTVIGISAANVAAMRRAGLAPRLVPNGVPPAPPGRKAGEPLVIGMLGTISKRKGSDLFLDAVGRLSPQLPGAEFRMIGAPVEGPERAWAERMVEQARRSGVRLGRCSDPYAELRDWDVLVAPSRDEPFGLVAAEAMASGVPVVAARVGGLPEVVGPDAAILVAPEDAHGLATAILELARDPGRRRAMGEAGRRRAEGELSLDRQADGVHRAYLAALAPQARAGA